MINMMQPIKKQIIPICLAFNLVTWILGAFFSMPVILSWPLTSLLCILIFIFCNYIRNKGKLASIYYIVFMFIMYIFVQGINGLASQIQGVPYYFWLTSIESWEDALSLYMVTTIIVLCAFYGSSIYYFTVIRIRLYMLVVLSLIATIIVSRVQSNIIDAHFIFFILLFLALYIEYIHQAPYIRNYQNYKAYMQAVLLFAVAVSSVSLIVPRPNLNIESNMFEELYNRYIKSSDSFFNTALLKEMSEVNMISANVSEREVFRVKADHPLYLRIQTWDQYKNNKWITENKDFNQDYRLSDEYKQQLQTLNLKTVDLLALLENMNKDLLSDELKTYTQMLEEYPFAKEYQMNEMAITTKNYEFQSLVSVPGIINITIQDKNDKIYYNDRLVFSIRNHPLLSRYEKYNITYQEQILEPEERSFQFIKTLDKDRYKQLLDFVYNNSKDEEVKQLITEYRKESVNAYNNYTSLPETTTKRTYKLAKTITQRLTSDYDKAMAIEEFFYKEGYRYDMKAPIVRKKDYIDYFLFRSRRGVCVQFASAMVVLARANGLPARYVEGYRCIEYDEGKQEYVVREKHGHAFPEIYISGYGWMVFEPTRVSDDNTMLQGMDEDDLDGIEIAKYINNNTILFTIILFVLSLMLFIILKLVVLSMSESFWRKKVFKITTLEAADAIFNRMLTLFHKIYLAKLTYETPETYAKRLYRNHSIDIRNVVEIFNKAHYGKIAPTKEQIQEAFNKYLEIFEKTKRKGASRR